MKKIDANRCGKCYTDESSPHNFTFYHFYYTIFFQSFLIFSQLLSKGERKRITFSVKICCIYFIIVYDSRLMTDIKENKGQVPYAIVEHSGNQYRVEAGDILIVNRIDAKPETSIDFGQTLYYENGSDIKIGRPILADVKVKATLLDNERGAKILVFKFKKTKNFRRRRGHRQELSRIRIDSISC